MKNGNYELVKAPKDYPGKLYREKYVYEHRLVWWENTGEVLSEHETIHHKNGNKRDNRFENLELLKRSKHSEIHGKEKTKTMVKLKCPQCGDTFERERRQTHIIKGSREYTTCSRSCGSKFGMKDNKDIKHDHVLKVFDK